MNAKVLGFGGRFFGVAMLLLSLLVAMKPAAAQTAGVILGQVKDPSGAAVPNATVTLTSVETGASRTATSGEDGAYRFSAVEPGHYNVKVESQGFKTSTITGITLDVAQELVSNVTLEVGTSTQEVTVTGEAPVVNTTSSSLGGLVSDQQISELPLNGRNYSDLALLQPGVTQTTHSGLGDAGIWFSSNGMSPRANNYTIDGTPILTQNGTGPAGMTGNTLGVDGIKEYRVVTSMFSAEYGLLMGSQIVVVSKGGSNQWHGDGFDYLRNSTLDARNYFDPAPSIIGHRLPEFRRNNFGGSVGGPIKKDKTFFLLVYEGLRATQGDTIQDTTMAAACHFWTVGGQNIIAGGGPVPAGIVVPSGATQRILQGPVGAATLTTTGCGGAPAGTSVASVVQPWIGQFPFPNESIPGVSSNYTFNGQTHLRDDYGQLRIDHNFSANDTFFARFTFDDARDTTPYLGGNLQAVDTGTGYQQFYNVGPSRNQYVTFGENHIFTPSLLNSIRLSFSRTNYVNHFATPNTPLNPNFQLQDAANCGQPGAPACIWSFIPGLFTGGFTPGSGVTALVPPGTFPNYHIQNTWTVGDDIFYTRGKHSLKFGTLFNRWNDPDLQSKAIFGTITFNNIYNAPAGTTPASGFITGIPTSINVVTPGSTVALAPGSTQLAPPFKGNFLERNWWYNTLGFYFQDDWRATDRLTLNLGVRYEFRTEITDSDGRVSALRDPLTSTSFTIGPIMTNPTYRNWSPRLGFAWDVFGTGKTAIRGGFGIYYDVANLGALLTQNPTGTLPWVANTTATWTPAKGAISLPLSCVAPCSGAIAASGAAVGKSLQNANYNAKSPHSYQFNLTAEQQLPKGVALGLSYVGTRGIDLFQGIEGNPVVPQGYDAAGNPLFNVTNGLAGCQNSVLTVGGANTFGANAFPCRINPYFGSSQLFTNGGESWYNGLQVVVTKRLSKGLSFQGAYTYSKSMDDTQGVRFNDDCGGVSGNAFSDRPLDVKQSWALSCYDITNVFNMNILYHLPTLNSDGLLSKVTNGWWFSSIVTVQGGSPFTPIINTDRSFSGVITQSNTSHASINTVAQTVTFCNGSPVAAGSACSAALQTVNFIPFDKNTVMTGNPKQWFNPLMFGEPPLGQLGNVPRNFLRQPGLGNWNFSLVKDTKVGFLGEAGSVQFRAEVFNVTNRANFQMLGISTTAASVFAGTTAASTLAGGDIQAPLATAGQITNTATTSRQIQLALRVSF
ncbi:MAG TPA: TonB-dependent receptor [Candidatus Acidoferrales bacterium]|nr:TonB-dependent receptor [Candidatus Acidoferrales bacterium]